MIEERPVPKIGIHIGISMEDYRKLDAVNAHTLWRLVEDCPAEALYEWENGTEETKALAFGSLTDFVLLEPGRFKEQAVVEPEIGEGLAPRRPTQRQIEAKKPSPASLAAIEFWANFDTNNLGKIIVSRSDYDAVMEIEAQVRSVQCRELILGGRSQVCIVWQDRATKLLCKARLDYERQAGFNHFITDLKTSRGIKPEFWQWAIGPRGYGYFFHMAYYHDGWLAVTGDTSLCNWLVVKKGKPMLVKGYETGDLTLEAGRLAYRAALDKWAECVKKNEWPDYGPIEIIDMNRWDLERLGVGPHIIRPEPAAAEPQVEDARSFEEIYQLEETEVIL